MTVTAIAIVLVALILVIMTVLLQKQHQASRFDPEKNSNLVEGDEFEQPITLGCTESTQKFALSSCPSVITGYCLWLGSSLISWKCKKQPTISQSSAEAEYRALANVTCEVIWIINLLQSLQQQVVLPVPISCDSKSATAIARNPVFHERTKHIEIDCHLVRDKFKANVIFLHHVTSSEQPADILTKPLSPGPFYHLLSKLGVHNLYHTNLEGGGGDHQIPVVQANTLKKGAARSSCRVMKKEGVAAFSICYQNAALESRAFNSFLKDAYAVRFGIG